ncbi:MAG: 3-dehydroquinate synthase [Candidatus Krumholzibacteria bacterium]|nr:3-dehydroquinate synthase [Candidatus Krumholzibacteria bacterium]MDH4337617.1 3-dehydroquinate synthase [Candidatus Krumholzibacteria bacterium]MDH5270419.1 3-dehydroquinate synthase [Candidatus Krumholzibacteria bacterium]
MTKPSQPSGRPVVVLCGFMGTGKTAVGRILAASLGVPFLDTDDMVESETGMSVAEIFSRDGEARFRELESEACASINTRGGAVVATGGGILLREENARRLASLGQMVLLRASVDAIVARTEGSTRPLLPTDTRGATLRERVAQLIEERGPVYGRVAWQIDTTERSPAEVAFEIGERLHHPHRLLHLRADVRPVPGHALRPGEGRLCRIVVGRGVIDTIGGWIGELGVTGTAYVLASRRVAGFHGQRTRAALDKAAVRNRFIEVDDSEEAKTLDQTERLLYELVDAGATRDGVVVALGGGVTGDVAGFAAATFMRGMPLVQVPTTLLAQVDSSIGGKVGVNHPRAKNLIGAVHQPLLVMADIDTIGTLPPRQVASGMAEVIKTAIIGSPALFDTLTRTLTTQEAMQQPELLETCVAECAAVKVAIVENDPYEHGPRRVLNLGHTLGHAVEAVAGFGSVLHGEAVALGILAAIRVSMRRGAATRDFLAGTRAMFKACGLPLAMPDMDRDALIAAMGLDKKRRAGSLTFVLPVAPGDVRFVSDVTPDEILAATTD